MEEPGQPSQYHARSHCVIINVPEFCYEAESIINNSDCPMNVDNILHRTNGTIFIMEIEREVKGNTIWTVWE